jgi:hypothetical protein
LRVFENRVLRKIIGPKRDEVMGEWRKLHNEELRRKARGKETAGKTKTYVGGMDRGLIIGGL